MPYLSEVVFTTPVKLIGNRAVIRKQETNFGNVVSDAYRLSGNADVGFAAAVTIRQDLEVGPVTRDELLKSLGSEQRLVSFNYTGQQILDVMELALATYPEETNNFQHISGMHVQFDPTKVAGERIYKITMHDDSTLDPKKTYRIIAREDMLFQFLSEEEIEETEFISYGLVYPTFIAYANSGVVFKDTIANRLEVVNKDALEAEDNTQKPSPKPDLDTENIAPIPNDNIQPEITTHKPGITNTADTTVILPFVSILMISCIGFLYVKQTKIQK